MTQLARTALALAALGALDRAGVEVAYAPEPGSAVERRWSESLELEVDSLDEAIDGEPVNLPFDVIEMRIERGFVVEDELTASEGGRPTDLTRSFGATTLAFEVELDGQDVGTAAGGAACEDVVARFLWDAEEETYDVEVEGGHGHPELLRVDMDLLGLLPEGEVEEDATWAPDPDALRAFFAAGGELGFAPREATIQMEGAPAELLIAGSLCGVHAVLARAEEISGDLEARFVGVERGEDEAELARIEVRVEADAEAELGDSFRALFHEADVGTHDLRVGVELEGTLVLLWDLAAGHLRSATYEGDVGVTGHLVFPTVVMGRDVSFVGDYEMYGSAEVELVVE